MHDYTDLDLFSPIVQIIDDADPPNAANFNTPNEALLDRTRYLLNRAGTHDEVHTSGTGTFVVPLGVTHLGLEGSGAHGGGGGGATASTSTDHHALGGGGGGTAEQGVIILPVTGGESYAWSVGTGGVGGLAGLPGADGGDTVFINGGATNGAVFNGASGGQAGIVDASSPPTQVVFGGVPTRPVADALIDTTSNLSFGPPGPMVYQKRPGEGGASHAVLDAAGAKGMGTPRSVVNSISLIVGGAGGAHGTDSGTQRGGSGGGGGAAGVNGSGGAGGAAGNGSGTNGTNGQPGSTALGGGGGGGGGGSGASSGGTGGVGGAGGNGFLRITTLRFGA